MSEGIRVNRSLTIPPNEIEMRFSTSGGPGGQHANRSSTRAEASWNVETSAVLGPRQRQRLREKLRHRIDSNGVLRVASDTHRSQLRNREEAVARLARLVSEALRPRVKRIATTPSQKAKERRLESKRRHSQKKRARRAISDDWS
jgi:ribosome-associated protein